ncbi:amidase family protein [Leucobacter allii]|uniref:Amidase family protein n=1 Tax=Leucobacter allii TaxID=2932247 RepID=A0ABY4FK18_9MICO|nr:amidase family protein [Leucobacter allii]UOQ56656.1 amidase family protein [Leucobacter allii]
MEQGEAWSARRARDLARGDARGIFVAVTDARPASGAPPSGGPLGGAPFAAKDTLDTRALPTTGNTPALLGTHRSRDNPVLSRLIAAGAELIGKTSTHELALGITTSAAAFPACRNPADPERSPGGSSGGSGAAVAAGIVPFAIGTDTGGSISIPAAWCGVFGLRPTTGRWPVGGVVPLSRTRDTVGVIADSVGRLAAVDAVAVGDRRPPSDEALRLTSGARIRIGVPDADATFTRRLADPVRRAWEESLDRLRASGSVTLIRIETEELHEIERRCGHEIEFFEIARELTEYLAGLPRPLRFGELLEGVALDEVGEALRESVRAGARSEHYAEALVARSALQARYDAMFATSGVQGLLYPTTPITAPRLGAERTAELGADESVFAVGTRNLNPGSVSGQPVVTLPAAGRDPGRAPVGVSLEGPRHADRGLLRVAGALAEILR